MTAFGVIALSLVIIAAGFACFTALAVRRLEALYPAVGDLVEVGGGAIHVVETPATGAERGVVLLLHGASGNHADMTAVLAAPLSALGVRVLAVDRPGHGWSSRILGRRASSPSLQAALIRAALARCGVDRAIVVGHSLGGVYSLALALEAPEFVRALVLLATVSHPWPGGVNWYYNVAAHRWFGPFFRSLIVMPAGLLTMAAGVREVFTPNPIPANYIESTKLKLVLRPKHFGANAEDVADIKPYVIAQARRYSTLTTPTEIVTGDADGVVYTHIHSIGCARDIPGAVLTTLPGVGHSPHHSAAESVVAAILRAEERAMAAEARAVAKPGLTAVG